MNDKQEVLGFYKRESFQPTKPAKLPAKKEERAGYSVHSANAYRASDRKILRQQILEFLGKRGGFGATTDEVSAEFDRMPNEVSPQFTRLRKDGEIERTGRTRKTRRGVAAAVHVLKE